jgi:hypothetical protein
MAKVEIIDDLKQEVFKKFKGESVKVFESMRSLGNNPYKGKIVGQVGGLVIKELKYKLFRFYFIVDRKKLKLFSKEELINLLILFVRMSDKRSQQKVINEIKHILRTIGEEGF